MNRGTSSLNGSVSAVLIFDIPDHWTWQPVDSPAAEAETSLVGGMRHVRGTWTDRSCVMPADYVHTLDELIGGDADWLGTYNVDRHSELYLINILSHLGTCAASILGSTDTERRESDIKGMSASRENRLIPKMEDDNEVTGLSVQAIADCMELHTGIERTAQGVFFNVCYRLNLPSNPARMGTTHETKGPYGPSLSSRATR